jgi:hypothetical protein
MLAIVEELLAGNLVALDRVDADLFERDPLAGSFGRDFEGEVNGELVGPLKNGPRTFSPWIVLLPCQTLDFWMTGCWPAVSSPPPSTETMVGAYIVSITPKFLPWLHNSTNRLQRF